jgi:hypothetical protein
MVHKDKKRSWGQIGKDIGWSVFTYVVTALLGAGAAILGIHPEKIIEKEFHYVVGSGVELPDGEFRAFGWEANPQAVEEAVKGMKFPVFSKTPAGAVDEEVLPDKVYLWEAARYGLKRDIPVRDQKSVGSCVAFGAVAAVEYLQAVQIAKQIKDGRVPAEFRDLSTEYVYGISRVQIGGGRLRGTDGSVGIWAARGLVEYGVVARDIYGSIDLRTYNESTCRRYGDYGPPQELLPIGKQHLVGAISPVKTTDELRHALASGYPVTTASGVGFGSRGPWKRDADGILYESGSWQHQQAFIGYTKHPTKGWLFAVMNSWGNWIGGPKGMGDLPEGSYYVLESTAKRMLRADDSWAISSFGEFNPNILDWFVANPKKRFNPLFDVFCIHIN